MVNLREMSQRTTSIFVRVLWSASRCESRSLFFFSFFLRGKAINLQRAYSIDDLEPPSFKLLVRM